MNNRPTPETDACWQDIECNPREHARNLERERDEWKQKFIQQNKDMLEMMDPNGTIWNFTKKLKDENKALKEQLDAALMVGKLQERRHERELAEARGESFQVQAWKQLTEQHRNEMRGL